MSPLVKHSCLYLDQDSDKVLNSRQVLGDGRASEDLSVLRSSDSPPSAAEVQRQLGEEVRPLVPEDAGIRSDTQLASHMSLH